MCKIANVWTLARPTISAKVPLLVLFAPAVFAGRDWRRSHRSLSVTVVIAFLINRIVAMAGLLFAAAAIIFVVLEVLPGDPAAVMLGVNAAPDTLAALRVELGLDRPPWERFLSWIAGVLRGDFGTSYTYGEPVAALIGDRLAVTVPLALAAVVLSTAIGIPLGMLAAAHHNRPADYGVIGIAQLGVAVPNFWLGILLVLVFSVMLGWFPSGGFPGWGGGPVPALHALLLPTIAMALPQAAILARITRSAALEVLREDHVRTARAKGLLSGQILRRHVLRNALIPVVSIMGLQVSFLLAGTVIIENVFYLPGLGRLVLQAVLQRDLIVVKAAVLLLSGLVVTVTFLVDIAHGFLDPRLRAGANG